MQQIDSTDPLVAQIPQDTSSNKPERSTFAISITLLTPGLNVPYSQPKRTPENPASPNLKFTCETAFQKPNLGLFCSGATRTDMNTMRPTKELADRPFEQYRLNVHPISRTVHKPSLEQVYREIYGDSYPLQYPTPLRLPLHNGS